MDSALPIAGASALIIGAGYALGFAGMNAAAERMPAWLRRTLTGLAFVWLAVIAAIAAFVIGTGR